MRWKDGLKSALKWVLKFALAIVLVLGLAEISVRAAYAVRSSMMRERPQAYVFGHTYTPFPPWVDSMRMIEYDRQLIWKMRSSLDILFVDAFSPARTNEEWLSTARGFLPTLPDWMQDNPVWRVSLNAEGFRDDEFDDTPSESTFRVVCLGDSWTFGSNVGQDSSFSEQLELRLASEYPGADVDVINLGVPGHSSHQGLVLFERTVLDLAPDVVVIGYGGVDGHLSSWRDRSALERIGKWGRLISIVTKIELPKLVHYVGTRMKKKDILLGDRLTTTARLAANTRAKEADTLIETRVRVPPEQFDENVREMIRLARGRDAETVLLFNDLEGRVGLAEQLETLYWDVLERISTSEGVPLVDGRTIIGNARREEQQELEQRLGLSAAGEPAAASAPSASAPDETEVLFRVYLDDREVPGSVFISGTHPDLGGARPNEIAMHDDGTHGDQNAGDRVWSLAVRLPRGEDIFYVYTNSGTPGAWEGLDVPHLREFVLDADDGATRVVRPIDSFGKVYVQSDSWHPDHHGHELIAEQLLDAIVESPQALDRLRGSVGAQSR